MINFYGFISDTLFYPKTKISLTQDTPNVCYLDDNMVNYFHEHAMIKDHRRERLLFRNKLPTDKIIIHFDSSKQKDNTVFTDKIDDLEYQTLFYIFETIYLSDGKTYTQILQTIVENSAMSQLYIDRSLILSSMKLTGTIPEFHTETNLSVPMFTYFQIDLKFKNIEEPVRFKLWLGKDAFLEDYPLSTICKVVLPVEPSYLITPEKATSSIEMLLVSNNYSFDELSIPVADGDHSGFLSYKTKWVLKAPYSVQMLPFGILYQGAKPTTMQIREAIRNVLLGLGIASQSTWEDLFPDLFVIAQFFIVPIWDHITVRPERKLFPSIINVNKFSGVLEKIFPGYELSFIDQIREVFTCGQSEIFLLSIPDVENSTEYQSIFRLHPTYQYHTQMDIAFQYMDITTQEFTIRLNKCMSVAMGETTLSDVATNIYDGKIWLSFVSTKVEYHVLTYDSYMEVFQPKMI